MIIDTHGHYDDEQFDVDREMLLTNSKGTWAESNCDGGCFYADK